MNSNISAELVKTLRERSGCGFMECKKALASSSGDLNKALEFLRKAGAAKAEKKSERIAEQGLILVRVSTDEKTGFMLELNCETDFVANDESFKKFAENITEAGFKAGATNVETLLQLPIAGGSSETVAQAREALIAKIGENIQIRRLALIKARSGIIGSYLHGGKAAALVEITSSDKDLAKDLAMQVVAMRPEFISAKDVDPALLAKEKEIYLAQAKQSGKPEAIAEKMVAGRLDKFTSEITLLGQAFVKDPNITIGKLLQSKKTEVLHLVRFALGEK